MPPKNSSKKPKKSSVPSSKMLDRLSKEANEVFKDVVQSTYRSLSPDVCTILTFDIGAKNIDTMLQTIPETTVRHESSMPLKMFLIEHFYNILKQSLPKKLTTNPFGRRKNKNKGIESIQMTPLNTMEMFLKDLYVKKDKDDDDDEMDDDDDVESRGKNLCLGSTFGAVASIFGSLKTELEVQNPCNELFPLLRRIVQSIKIVVECHELRTENNARVLLRAMKAFTTGMVTSNSSQSDDDEEKEEKEQEDDEDEGDVELNENHPPKMIWLSIVDECCKLSINVGRYISSLVDLDKDTMQFLSCIASIANLQNYATDQIKLASSDEGDDDFFVIEEKKNHYTASTTLLDLCYDILSEGWGDANEDGTCGENMKNATLSCIINYYLKHSEHCLDNTGNVVNSRMKVTEELIETHLMALFKMDGCVGPVPNFLSLHKKTLPCYYATILNNLVDLTKSLQFNKSDNEVTETCMYNLQKIANWLSMLVMMTKQMEAFQTTYILSATLKNVRAIIDLLNKHIDTFFRSMISKNNYTRQRVLAIFKKLQKSTRQVQNICTHGKNIAKNMALTSLIPHVKRALETFLFKIQAVFVSTGNRTAVKIGNLKHKGLDGKEFAINENGLVGDEEDEDEEDEDEVDEDEEDENEEDENEVDPDGENYFENFDIYHGEDQDEEDQDKEDQDEEEITVA